MCVCVCVCVRACMLACVCLSLSFELIFSDTELMFFLIILYSYFSHMIDMDVIHNLRTHKSQN